MMLRNFLPCRHKGRGFTLVELAIVLAVASLLFAGLWRLMSAGNTQLRDQAAADQMNQLLAAVKTYLASTDGAAFRNNVISGTCPTIGTVRIGTLDLPGWAGAPSCAAGLNIGNYMPPGFVAGTQNSYGQTYGVNVAVDPSNVENYSFMIKTTGGTAIPDSSGSRIAAMIGGDGGFIYTTDVCNAVSLAATSLSACGAFGGWGLNIATYNFPAESSRVAARSIGGTQSPTPWLARETFGDPNEFNTMHVPLGFEAGVAPINMNGNNINLGGGTINGGTVANPAPPPANIPVGVIQNIKTIAVGDVTNHTGPGLTVSGPQDAIAGPGGTSYLDTCGTGGSTNCAWIARINGNAKVDGMLYAKNLYAQSFVYETSDARLKKNIQKLTHPLEDLTKIPAVSFIRIDNDKPGMGVVAQDLEKIYPDLVSSIGDGYKGVDYLGLIGPLIGAVQELKVQNDQLREQIKEQGAAIKRLQKHAVR